jgi:hypothetical protein
MSVGEVRLVRMVRGATCLITEEVDGNSSKEKRRFGTMTRDLCDLAEWRYEAEVTAMAMEVTGVYWIPVWNVLELFGLQLPVIRTKIS